METKPESLDRAARLIQKCLEAISGLRESKNPQQRDLLIEARVAAFDARVAILAARQTNNESLACDCDADQDTPHDPECGIYGRSE